MARGQSSTPSVNRAVLLGKRKGPGSEKGWSRLGVSRFATEPVAGVTNVPEMPVPQLGQTEMIVRRVLSEETEQALKAPKGQSSRQGSSKQQALS